MEDLTEETISEIWATISEMRSTNSEMRAFIEERKQFREEQIRQRNLMEEIQQRINNLVIRFDNMAPPIVQPSKEEDKGYAEFRNEVQHVEEKEGYEELIDKVEDEEEKMEGTDALHLSPIIPEIFVSYSTAIILPFKVSMLDLDRVVFLESGKTITPYLISFDPPPPPLSKKNAMQESRVQSLCCDENKVFKPGSR